MIPEDGSAKAPGFPDKTRDRKPSEEDEWTTPTLPEDGAAGEPGFPGVEEISAKPSEDNEEWLTPPVTPAAPGEKTARVENPNDGTSSGVPRYVKKDEFEAKRGYQILKKYKTEDVESAEAKLVPSASCPDHVFKQEPFVEDEDDTYNMQHARRGVFVILNNKKFTMKGVQERTGTDVDADNLTLAFSRLGFRVRRYDDLPCKDMLAVMKQVASEDHSDSDCFGCAILSHGDEGIVYGRDSIVEIDSLLEPVKMCRSLRGKPKLFFIQACRGCKLDDGFDAPDGVRDKEQRIPQQADCLYAYSTTPGYFSWRNKGKGSWFVQALSSILERQGSRRELMWLLTSVNRRVAYDFQSRGSEPAMDMKKQIPCIRSQLTKQVFFRPKHSAGGSSNGAPSRLIVTPSEGLQMWTSSRSAPNSRRCSPVPPSMNIAQASSGGNAPTQQSGLNFRNTPQIAVSSRIQSPQRSECLAYGTSRGGMGSGLYGEVPSCSVESSGQLHIGSASHV